MKSLVWTKLSPEKFGLPAPISMHSIVAVRNNRIIAVGGRMDERTAGNKNDDDDEDERPKKGERFGTVWSTLVVKGVVVGVMLLLILFVVVEMVFVVVVGGGGGASCFICFCCGGGGCDVVVVGIIVIILHLCKRASYLSVRPHKSHYLALLSFL